MATVPDISKMSETIKSAMSAVEASIPSTSTVPNINDTDLISTVPSSISLEDIRLRVENLESQMEKLAGAFGTFGDRKSSKPMTVESILSSGGARRKTRRHRKARKFNRK
jgi:hypothetical protein